MQAGVDPVQTGRERYFAGFDGPLFLFWLFVLLFCLRVAFSFQIKDLCFCGQSLDGDESSGVAGEDLIPVSEGIVGGHDSAKPSIMPIGDDLEKQVSRLDVHANVAKLIDDKKRGHTIFSEFALEIVDCFSCSERIHNLRSACKKY